MDKDNAATSIAAIGTRAEFHDAIRAALVLAADAGVAEIVLVDPDFSDWPLNDRALVDTLTRWVDSRRRLTIMANGYDEFARRQVRFAEWRRQWSHVVQCRQDDDLEHEQIPTLLFVPGQVCIRLLDRVRYRGTVSARPIDLVACRETVDALLQRSVEAFPVTTLGL